MNIISSKSDLGGMIYPFLSRFTDWRIETRHITEKLDADTTPTLRWVKDDKVCDLFVPGFSADQFLAVSGLSLSMERGPFVLSKRLSRIMRPMRYFEFFQPNELVIEHSADLDAQVWDGVGLMSGRVLDRIIEALDDSHPLYELHKKEIEHCKRFEVTVMHDGGQEKGHVLLDENLAVDFLFPSGSAKQEVALTDRLFVGLQPVHSDEQMRLDVQSLVNLYPFFDNTHLAAWLHDESNLFIDCIRSGEFDVLLGRLGRFVGEQDFTQFKTWWLAEYVLSGGSLMWFNGTIRAMGRQHLNRIVSSEKKLRFPIPGGRFYILPDTVGNRFVPAGHAEVDPEYATVWVNGQDWNSHVAELLGGADGDDGCWCFPFTDHDDQKQILVWRSPNQLGEYVMLRPSAKSHTIQWRQRGGVMTWPRMDSRKLSPRIDTIEHEYGRLERFAFPPADSYTIESMTPAIEQAKINRGALGAYCNMLLLTKAIYSRLPHSLPARLEDVIDGSVKSFRDLSPVLAWVNQAASAIVTQGRPIPYALRRRIEVSLSEEEKQQLQFTRFHWIDKLLSITQNHIDMYQANLDALAADAQPPEDIFKAGSAWRKQGKALRHVYATGIRGRTQPEVIINTCLKMLKGWEDSQHLVMLGAAAEAIGDYRLSDSVLWQKETAPLMLDALRKIGLIGEPIWTLSGAAVYYDDPAATAVPVQINGVWFNWLRSRGKPLNEMSEVPKQVRTWAKEHIASLAAASFDNLKLHMHVTDSDRVVAYTESGNLFGYVQAGQELHAIRATEWQIIQARATDGNVAAVLVPA